MDPEPERIGDKTAEKEKEPKAEKKAKIPQQKKGFFKNRKDFFIYLLDILFNGIVIFGLVFLIRYFLISPFQVSGQSMCNTLNFVNGVCLSQQEFGEFQLTIRHILII